MKTKIGILIIILFASLGYAHAQDRITARATSYDISDNLDLKAVATIFGESRNLEEFEQKLNDPQLQISNLDLNQDGYVDYLRVIESRDNGISEVVIQAVLGDDVYQDVATIDVEQVPDGSPRVQIVGNAYLYGPDYIFEPVWVRTPIIFGFFWGPAYRTWHSPYYWGYYPSRFHYWKPFATYRYRRNVGVHVSIGNTFNFNINRRIAFPANYRNTYRRDDYARRYPDHSFSNRHEGIRNSTELYRRRSTNANYQSRPSERQTQRQRPETYRSRSERTVIKSQPSQNKTERRVTQSQPQQRRIERRTVEPVRQPRENNVVTRPQKRIETTQKSTTNTRRTETAPSRKETQRVKTSTRAERKQGTSTKKSDDKSEKRRR